MERSEAKRSGAERSEAERSGAKFLIFCCVTKSITRRRRVGMLVGNIRSFKHNAELQETRKTVEKTGFSDVQDCIVESNCVNSTKIGTTVFKTCPLLKIFLKK